ncbi:MAG TPA: hypothetical protein VHE30_30250 [Polyangiaceae bacterium]|nr:hypothetical protein [Polyangiaceae bacterium]
MKIGLIASILIHVGGLALMPKAEEPPRSDKSIAEECRCDYELTVTAARPPRALTLGEVPADRFPH